MRRMKRLEPIFALSMALVAILGSIASAPAQDYPSRRITMIVPYPAGGLFDALARILAEPMRGALAQSVVIENVGGAGGSIAVGSAPEEFEQRFKTDLAKFAKIVREAHIPVQD